MPIDHTGTAPGLAQAAFEPSKINMRCNAPGCDSILAVELKAEGAEKGARLYQCCKCKHMRTVAVGGGFTL